jgi:hypothetical protein
MSYDEISAEAELRSLEKASSTSCYRPILRMIFCARRLWGMEARASSLLHDALNRRAEVVEVEGLSKYGTVKF